MLNPYKAVCTIFLTLLTSYVLVAQEGYVDSLMSKLRKEGFARIDYQRLDDSTRAFSIINRLIYHSSDTSSKIRLLAYRLMDHVAQRAPQYPNRETVLDHLIRGLQDPVRMVHQQCMTLMTHYPDSLFSFQDRQAILTYALKEQDPEGIKLTGYLQPERAVDRLKPFLDDAQLNKETKVATRMALARMGDEVQINYLLNIMRNAEVNDDHLMAIGEMTRYVKDKRMIDYLLQLVLEDRKDCTSTDPDHSSPILCAYRAMEYAGWVIRDYPYGMRPSGDLDTDDYPEALVVIRRWIRSHPDYQITKNIY